MIGVPAGETAGHYEAGFGEGDEMAENLLDGIGDEESRANEFNLLATAKKRAVKKFLGGDDFPSAGAGPGDAARAAWACPR